MGRACSTNGEKRSAYRILVGKPEGKSPLGRPRSRWEYGSWIHKRGGMDWMNVVQVRDQ
jgi:hypothetical protein